VTVESGEPETVRMKTKAVVPELPSFLLTLEIVTLHSKRRSWRWFLSPQPLPGFVTVGVVVVVVEVDVEVDVEVVIVVEYSYAEATLLRLVSATPAARPSATRTARAKLTARNT